MANYQKVFTESGLAKLAEIASASGTLVWTAVKAGDGQIGAGDPADLTDIISSQQTFDAVDVRLDSNQVPYIYFIMSNAGLAAGYLRREVGIYGRMQGDPADTLILYLYAETDPEADFIPVPENGIASITTFRAQIVQAAGLATTVLVDNSTVFLALDRWADHLAGAGGVDQHPEANADAPGLMSATDKAALAAHVNPLAPTSGATIHAGATQAVPGFLSAADKIKLDGIAAGAEVNQTALWKLRVKKADGSEVESLTASAKQDTWALQVQDYMDVTASAANKSIYLKVVNVTPSSHIGSRGAQHANATTNEAGFQSAADKTKLDGIQTGAEVNQNAFSIVKVGGTTISADAKQDALELIAGADIALSPNAAGDSVSIALAATHAGAGGAVHPVATGAAAGFMSAADKALFDKGKPYYAIKANYLLAVLADMVGHANTKLVGPQISPKGGINYTTTANSTMFEMRVNNVSGSPITKQIFVVHNNEGLHYQIDDGSINQLLAATSYNQTVSITIPTGLHTLRFYLVNLSDIGHLLLSDWLDNDVVWAAGGVYY